MAPIIEVSENTLKILNPTVYTLRNDLIKQPATPVIPQSPFQLATRKDYFQAQVKAINNSRAYNTIMKGIDSKRATGSQFFFNNLMNGITLEDLERIYSSGREELFDGSFYTDTIDLILRTDKDNYGANQPILDNLVKQIKEKDLKFSAENPLRIQGLDLVADENTKNEYGLLLKINDNTRIVNDKRFAYGRNEIRLGNKTIPLYTKDNGLSVVCLNGDGVLVAWSGSLACSDDDGRVVVRK